MCGADLGHALVPFPASLASLTRASRPAPHVPLSHSNPLSPPLALVLPSHTHLLPLTALNIPFHQPFPPQGNARDKLQEFFIGGSKELEDPAYLLGPSGAEAAGGAGAGSGIAAGMQGGGRVVNKYGFKTESTGVVKLRWNAVVQSFDVGLGSDKAGAWAGGAPVRASAGGGLLGAAGAAESPGARARNRREMSLNEVVARARAR